MEGEPYRPAPQVLTRLRDVDFLAVVGASAAGKSTVIEASVAREPELRPVCNNTSRRPRPGERDGVDFRFETRDRMLDRIGNREYVQVAPNAFGDFYATAPDGYATSGVAVLPVLADAVAGFRRLPFRTVRAVYVLPPDPATWRARLARRQWDPATFEARMAEARRSLAWAIEDPQVRFIVNEGLDTSVADLITIALCRPLPRRLATDQCRARALAQGLLGAVPDRAAARSEPEHADHAL